ncbi:TonB-dependent receptor [uncultured Sphingomonas sp.]|uniref:TonB-dependent receptor n=1 Tax=uncultured Sphingomonas sp. TaxID=158754 RepID=UPI0025EA3270|nr:TonB-dependent receptor [uncultured Sphingomonas sp.]
MKASHFTLRAGLLTAVSAAALVPAAALAQQSSTTQGVLNSAPTDQAASPSAAAAEAQGEAAAPSQPTSVTGANAGGGDEIVVTGIRGAQTAAVNVKRNAASVVDAISAEDIGKLPDVTISDSLQRIPGVQIRREAGEGGAVNVRGLPQVQTLLNGEAYLGANSITSIQPNFTDIPSQLFAGADVIKSTTADLLNAGITGTINLRTRRPFDLKDGITAAVTAETSYGDKVKRFNPQANLLVGYHTDGFGALLSASYADVKLSNSHNGIQEGYGGALHNEGFADATSGNGFSPANRPNGTRLGNGIDVNGDGDANDTYWAPQSHTAWDREIQRKRLGINGSIQAELSDAFEFVADGFYTRQLQYDRIAGFQFQDVNWQAAEFTPGASRRTGVNLGGFDFNTIQRYDYDLGNFDSYSENLRTLSSSKNFNAELKYDNGGKFKATLRGIYGKAKQDRDQSYTQFSLSNGAQWQPNGIGHYPASLGGDRAFNQNGYLVNTIAGANSLPAVVDYTGGRPTFTLPSQLTTLLADPNNYALKTISSEGNYSRDADLKVVRADGSYAFSDQFNLTFGARWSDRDAQNTTFDRVSPLYPGLASDPNGCLVKWKAFDVNLTNTSTCSAGDAAGFFTAGLTRKATDQIFGDQLKQYNLPVNGVPAIYVLDPNAQDHSEDWQNKFYPGSVNSVQPGASYRVGVEQRSGYVQANFDTDIGIPFQGNVGVRIIQTRLDITQNLASSTPQAYGVSALPAGTLNTKRDFTDVLPAINLAFGIQPNLKLRAAYSKTMTLLNLDQWGGGLTLNYAIDTSVPGSPVFAVRSGNSDGNPALDPWRADNYDLSLEYYIGRASLLNVGFFYIDVESFIQRGSITRTDLPDNDGVVRNRNVQLSTPIQGSGGTLKGFELGAKLAFSDVGFVPDFFRDFGIDANFTYSPSKGNGDDLLGKALPFQDNSKVQTNLALWYQGEKLQARVAHNFRSKRLENGTFSDLGGGNYLQLWQKPTNYIDASISYDFTPNFTLYAQGSNLTAEREQYYLTFKDLRAYDNIYERRFLAGARVKF